MHTYFTRINADYYGVQYMLDSPLQIALGSGWSAYQDRRFEAEVTWIQVAGGYVMPLSPNKVA